MYVFSDRLRLSVRKMSKKISGCTAEFDLRDITTPQKELRAEQGHTPAFSNAHKMFTEEPF